MSNLDDIKKDSDATTGQFFKAEVHDSVADARKERDEFKSLAEKRNDEVIKLTKENEWLKSDNAILEDADVLRNVGAGILSVCGFLTLIPEEYRSLSTTWISSEIWYFIYFSTVVGAISVFCCGVWLRRRKRKTQHT